jgi:hypothetical protein
MKTQADIVFFFKKKGNRKLAKTWQPNTSNLRNLVFEELRKLYVNYWYWLFSELWTSEIYRVLLWKCTDLEICRPIATDDAKICLHVVNVDMRRWINCILN